MLGTAKQKFECLKFDFNWKVQFLISGLFGYTPTWNSKWCRSCSKEVYFWWILLSSGKSLFFFYFLFFSLMKINHYHLFVDVFVPFFSWGGCFKCWRQLAQNQREKNCWSCTETTRSVKSQSASGPHLPEVFSRRYHTPWQIASWLLFLRSF